MQQYIFKPLNMQHTGIDVNDRLSQRKAIGYQATPDNEYAVARFNDMSVLAGAGAMYSTAADLYKWDRALYKTKFLSAASLEQMFQPNPYGYAFGWEIDTVKGRVEVSHSGSIDGYKSNIIRYPAEDVCIIFLSNYFESKGAQISKALTAIAFDEPYELPKQRKFIKLAEPELQKLVGTYQMEKGPEVRVFIEEGILKGRLDQQQPFRLLAESGTQFYIKPIDTEVVFQPDAQGNILEMIFQQGKKKMVFRRGS
jgi:CubicO group peptidase (beta-lactamase class C family)